jgi:hypothetical protein
MGTLAQNSINLLPNSVFEAAKAGDTEAVELILKHYSRYINKLCCRKLYSENGFSCVCLDETMKRRLEIKLIYAIVMS